MYQYICNDIIRSYDSVCRLHLCWHLGLQPFPSLFLVLRPLESKSACCWHCRKNPDLRNPLVLKCAQVKSPSKKKCQVRCFYWWVWSSGRIWHAFLFGDFELWTATNLRRNMNQIRSSWSSIGLWFLILLDFRICLLIYWMTSSWGSHTKPPGKPWG